MLLSPPPPTTILPPRRSAGGARCCGVLWWACCLWRNRCWCLTLSYEAARAQEQVDQVAAEVAARAKQIAGRDLQGLQSLLWEDPLGPRWRDDAAELLRRTKPLLRIEYRDAQREIIYAAASPYVSPLFAKIAREQMQLETELACVAALRQGAQLYSRSYFVPMAGGEGPGGGRSVPAAAARGQVNAFVVATVGLRQLLEESVSHDLARGHELSFVEGDRHAAGRTGRPAAPVTTRPSAWWICRA